MYISTRLGHMKMRGFSGEPWVGHLSTYHSELPNSETQSINIFRSIVFSSHNDLKQNRYKTVQIHGTSICLSHIPSMKPNPFNTAMPLFLRISDLFHHNCPMLLIARWLRFKATKSQSSDILNIDSGPTVDG